MNRSGGITHTQGPRCRRSSGVTRMTLWIPHTPQGLRCVVEASCCEEFVLCSEGAVYYVIRRDEAGEFQETARGEYGLAFTAWMTLADSHTHEAKTA